MSKKITKEILDDLFAIPRDGSNINDDEDSDSSTINVVADNVPFEEKAKDIFNEISKQETGVVIQPKTATVATEKPIEPLVASVIKKEPLEPKIVDTAPKVVKQLDAVSAVKPSISVESAIPKISAPVKVVENVILSTENSEIVETSEEKEDNFKTEIEIVKPIIDNTISQIGNSTYFKFSPNGHSWKLTSPSAQYISFYRKKKETILDLIQDQEIPFDKYYEELQNTNIDITVDSYDSEGISQRITDVMKCRDRVKYIQLHLNKQYFAFKNFVDLLKGVLANVENMKGKKQEGIEFEHMSDFVSYTTKLEGLNKSAEIVSKHLDAAYASLSRQVAISQPTNEVERSIPVSNKMTQELRKFDSLQTKKNVENNGVIINKQREVSDKKGTESNQQKSGWNI